MNKFEERTNQYVDNAVRQTQVHLESNVLSPEIVRQWHQMGLSNPFLPIWYYIKGEISDIKAMEQTIISRQTLIKSVVGLVTKR
jgi:hypothetical protein